MRTDKHHIQAMLKFSVLLHMHRNNQSVVTTLMQKYVDSPDYFHNVHNTFGPIPRITRIENLLTNSPKLYKKLLKAVDKLRIDTMISPERISTPSQLDVSNILEQLESSKYTTDQLELFLASKIQGKIEEHLRFLELSEPFDYSKWYDTKHSLNAVDKTPLVDAVMDAYKLIQLDNIL